MVAIACPECGAALNVPAEKIGKVGKCSKCGSKFTAVEAEQPPSATKAALQSTGRIAGQLTAATGRTGWKATKAVAAATSNALNRRRERKDAAEIRKEERIEAERLAMLEPIPCPYCGEPINRVAKKCRHCNEYLEARPVVVAPVVTAQPVAHVAPTIVVHNVNTATATVVGVPRVKHWSRLVALLLSFICPGLGQLYKGHAIAGVLWFVVVAVGYVCFIIPGVVLHLLCVLSAASGDPNA